MCLTIRDGVPEGHRPPGPFPRGPPAGRGSVVRDAHELYLLVIAAHGVLLDVPYSLYVVLLLRDPRVELRSRLNRAQRLLVGALGDRDGSAAPQHAGLIERVARVVLLAILVALLRVARHDDSRLRALDAALPGVAHLDEVAVLELARVLPHVPDVPVLVLGVPVEGLLDRPPVGGDGVAHHRAGDTENLNRPWGDDHVVPLGGGAVLRHALVVEAGARLEREVRVVDRGDEVRRIDLRRVGAVDRRQGGGGGGGAGRSAVAAIGGAAAREPRRGQRRAREDEAGELFHRVSLPGSKSRHPGCRNRM